MILKTLVIFLSVTICKNLVLEKSKILIKMRFLDPTQEI